MIRAPSRFRGRRMEIDLWQSSREGPEEEARETGGGDAVVGDGVVLA